VAVPVDELEILIRARYPIIYIVSWEEDRVVETLAEVAGKRNKQVYVWACTTGFCKHPNVEGDTSTRDPVQALRFVLKSSDSALFVFKDFDAYLTNPEIIRAVRDLSHALKTSYKTAIILSPVLKIPPHLEKDITVFDFPLPGMEELSELLSNIIRSVQGRPDVRVEADPEVREKIVKAALGLTCSEAENVFAKALVLDRQLGPQDVQVIIGEKRQIIRKSGILEFYPAQEQFADIGGLSVLKEWLEKRQNAFAERAREFGLPQPKGILLLGVQGCGKSLTAKAVGALWNLPLLRLDVGAVFAGVVGSSEENMRRAIRTAESIAPCVLWIDELEKGFAGMQSSTFSDAGTTARVFGSFITWLQEKTAPVFVMATANQVELLPPELLRKGRFDEIFFVDLPAEAERNEIFAIHLRKRGRDPAKFDCAQLARLSAGFSGAEIEQVVIDALYDAFDEHREVTTEDLVAALKATVPLSTTMREQITALRDWARTRARSAHGPEAVAPEPGRTIELA